MTGKLHQGRRSLTLVAGGGTANRVMGTVNGTAMAMVQATVGMAPNGLFGRTATRLVAASNASQEVKNVADYVCDGVADEVEIHAAWSDLGLYGGTVLLSEGRFTLAAALISKATRVVLRGMGMGATTLFATAGGGGPLNTNLVQVVHDDCELADLTIDGDRADNGALTNMTLLLVQGARTLVHRVSGINSPGHGFILQTGANIVIRECLVVSTFYDGIYLRAPTGQPIVAQGCTTSGTGRYGIVIDGGPASVSDCAALASAGDGFITSNVAPASLRNCLAQGNAGVGFRLNAADGMLTDCRAVSNTGRGFHISAARSRFYGCVSETSGTEGFLCDGSADLLVVGCTVRGATGAGYVHSATGVGIYLGCQALGSATYGFNIGLGTVHIVDCTIVGVATGNHGIWVQKGANSILAGNRIATIGTAGIGIGTGGPPNTTDHAILDNAISDVGLKTNNVNYGIEVYVGATNCHIAGNSFEIAGSGNRAYGSIFLDTQAASNHYVGLNDFFNGYLTTPYSNVMANNTRRAAKLQLDYSLSSDAFNNTAIAAATWYDICPDQTFRVDMQSSIVEITVRANMLTGITGGPCVVFVQVLIDGGTYQRREMCEHIENGGWQSPFGGGHNWKLQQVLAVGNHTVRVQFYMTLAGIAYLRGVGTNFSGTVTENLHIQVVEYAR